MLAFASLVLLGGCNDQLRVVSFEADPAGTFVFTAQTNTVMTENDDGEAEQIRRDWLADELNASGICGAGYFVGTRRLGEAPDGITTTSPACNSTVVPCSPPSRTRTEPPAMPSTSCAVLW